MATALPTFPEFNLRNQSNLAARWEKYLKRFIISNNMTRGKLAIKFPDAEGRFVKVRGRSPRTFTNLPEASGNLIANFPTSHVISL